MSWDEYADRWDDDAAVRAYSGGAISALLRLEEAEEVQLGGARVLDFGCGTGLLAEKMAAKVDWVVALDTSRAMIEVLKGKVSRRSLDRVLPIAGSLEDALATQGDVFKHPFDLITCSSVCAFLDDYPETVESLAKLLRPGGALVQWDWELDPDSDEPFGLTRGQIEGALSAAGLKVVRVDVAFDIEFEDKHMRPLIGVGVR
jgi:2-polyprenyl-3-methyl-5-hydroxy-6-metoxy-1,4-benzoquinol methylase